jgi:hypothetical protein
MLKIVSRIGTLVCAEFQETFGAKVFGSHEVSVSEQPLAKRSLSKSLALVKKKAL